MEGDLGKNKSLMTSLNSTSLNIPYYLFYQMINQFFLFLNFILIASLLTITVFKSDSGYVFSFKAPAPVPANVPPPQILSADKNNDQVKAINDNTNLNKSNSNLTSITNDTNSSIRPSMNNNLDPGWTDKEYKNFQGKNEEDLADEIFNDVKAQLEGQGIHMPLPYG
jgi:hypothetical protein